MGWDSSLFHHSQQFIGDRFEDALGKRGLKFTDNSDKFPYWGSGKETWYANPFLAHAFHVGPRYLASLN